MDVKLWQHQTFYNNNETSKNFLDFHVYDLTDVNLGRFVIGLQTTIDFQKFATIKNIIRESIERFAIIAKPLTVFEGLEKIYAYINKYSRDILEINDYHNLHIAIIYIKDNEMHFSIQGDLKLMLVRKNHIFDVIKMTYGLAPHNYDKLFSRMYSGSINENDHIILTSFETWDCFDVQKLIQIVSKLSADSAVGFMSNYLPEHSPYKLGGVLINLQIKEKESYNPNKPNLSPADSLKELIYTEDKTSEWISPSPKQKIFNLIETLKNISDKYLKYFVSMRIITKYSSWKNKNNLKPIQYQKVTTQRPEINKIIRTKSIQNKRVRVSNLWSTITNLPTTIRYVVSRTIRLYKKWPKSTKYLLITALVLVIILSQSISYTQKKNASQEQNTFFNQQIKDIEHQHTQANQAIIFKDYSKARTLLINASNAIAGLPAQDETQQDKKQSLTEINQQLLNRANRQSLINDPDIIADLDIRIYQKI